MTHIEQEYEELRNRYNDSVDKNAALRADLAAAIAERDGLKKTVEMAAILLKQYEDKWGLLT